MGAPVSDVKAGESQTAESLLDTFKSIDAAERRRHASVLNYWLSIKGDKDVAPIRDLDPLEISDAGPNSLLLELIGGGEDAEIKHRGDALKPYAEVEHLSAAPRPSLLASIAGKLAIVAISRNFLAFEDQVPAGDRMQTCWITLLPFSSTGVWVDYVYALVSVESEVQASEPAAEPTTEEAVEEAVAEEVTEESAPEEIADEQPVEEVAEPEAEIAAGVADPVEAEFEPQAEPDTMYEEEAPVDEKRPGFSKIFEALTGFHGTNVKVEPTLPPIEFETAAEPEPEAVAEAEPAAVEDVEPVVDEPEAIEVEVEPVVDTIQEEPLELVAEHPADAPAETPAATVIQSVEGPLQNKLEEVRGKADEARQAKLRSNLALYEGLSAAYDFALDAEDSPEEYLRLVEAQGLKIQLRSPMTPVVKLAFDGLCDEAMIGQLESVLAWALKQDLPRGSLAGRIEEAGGIGPILNGQAQAA